MRSSRQVEGKIGRVGIREVAATAGVSMTTVSNVLNRPHIVTPATRRRVEAAMDEVGYVRNGAARQLRGAPSRVVGCVVLDTANPFYSVLARGAEDRVAEEGCVLVQCSTDVRPERETYFLGLLREQGVRGILVNPVGAGLDHLVDIQRQGPRGMPLVLLDHPRGAAELCSVTVDNVRGGELAARHLLGLGHRRLAFVRATQPVRSVTDRAEGVRRALRTAGHDPARALVEVTTTQRSTEIDLIARQVVERLLAHAPRPTGVICFNDFTALALLRGMRQHGIEVPGEISVVGYDDIDFAAELSPGLTTIRQPTYALGRTAAGLLLSENQSGHRHREVVFQPELVIRESTRRPPA
ncbi:LacI family DNA-binding transcriptional regulator [Streptomyces sp. MAR4 CNX-425]|uniref:LacI family DNA-binding transcriptional regulator n=1 Tax=Streptomyces sp. MAR4 CNX-425 TaxID=3406343 RepID=UPI003B50FD3A